jgi:hypothetical protein
MLQQTMRATERTLILAALLGTRLFLTSLLALEHAGRRRSR